MSRVTDSQWKKLLVTPEQVLDNIRPGMTIFLGSGSAEPRTLMKCLMKSDLSNANDLELIQLGTHGDILSLKELHYQNYRLKTFFSGWVAGETATSLNVDLIPGRYSQIPRIIKSKRIPIDAAFIQIRLLMKAAIAASAWQLTWPAKPWNKPHWSLVKSTP